MSKEYNYKNSIELKDEVDEKTALRIRDLCLDVYNKGEERVKLVEHSLRRFDMVTDSEGKGNLMVAVSMLTGDDFFLNNIKYWHWEEPNDFECGDILGFIKKLEEKEKLSKWAV